MASIEELRAERKKKREKLAEYGMDPYSVTSSREHELGVLNQEFDTYVDKTTELFVAGRIMALREHGDVVFFDLFDGTGELQVVMKRDDVEKGELFDLFLETIDVGDFIDVTGTAFRTNTDQPSILLKSWKILSKALRPIPGQFHGLEDKEVRLRKRYLDILMNAEVRDMLQKKAMFWRSMRSFLEERGFLAVETPTLEITTGGAEATPFKTYHEDFDIDVYLRISVGELWQKRLMAAGLPRTYEIGRVYRNEGSSPEHLQEFTNMEFYAAYLDFEEGKEMVRNLYVTIAEEVFGTTSFESRGHTFDLSNEWQEIDYVPYVEEVTGVNVLEETEEGLEKKLAELGVEFEGRNRERMADSLWKYCRKSIAGPAFLVNHPKFVAPLSKVHPENPQLTKTFQVILAGSEVGRAHAELNDPLDQRERFEAQKELLEAGDTEAMMPDWEFVEMMEYGMPPTFGFGVGERLFSTLIGESIRETQIFPLLKPKQD